MDQASESMAAFATSQTCRDFVANGVAPDGTVDWTHSGAVRVLRDADRTMAVDGRTCLDQACAWIANVHPEQTPAKYGCRTWPQVLTQSGAFDLQYRADVDGREVAWFRLRAGTRCPRQSS